MTEILRVILVSDDEDDRSLASMVLRQSYEEIEVLEASDALTFADHLAGGAFSVAVSAPHHTWADGVAVLGTIKRRNPECATILFGENLPERIDTAIVDVKVEKSSRGFLQLPHAIEQAQLRAHSEDQKLLSSASYERLVEKLPLGIFKLGVDEAFYEANEAALRVLGYRDVAALVGRRLPDLLVDVDLRMKCRALMERGQGLSDLDTEIRRADGGTVQVSLSLWPVKSGGERVSLFEGVLWDLAALSIKGTSGSSGGADELASALSHDLQDPLQVIAQYARLLKDRHGAHLSEDAIRLIARMSESAARMQTMLDGIVEFSNIGALARPFQVVDMNQVIGDAIANLELAIEKSGAEIEFVNLKSVVGEPRQLLQLCQNLIGNAIKYRAEAPPRIVISVSERDNDWLISVSDNGLGIDNESADRVFGMFQRLHTSDEIPGRGLGLAICKRIAQCHGGRIWVESTPGHGSTFFVTIAKDAQSKLAKRDRRQGTG